MNDPNSVDRNSTSVRERRSSRATPIRRLVFLVVVVILLIVTFVIHAKTAPLKVALETEKARTENAILALRSTHQRVKDIEAAKERADLQRDQLAQIYRSYRSVDDFAPNPSEFVVSAIGEQRELNDRLTFSLPTGMHDFQFKMTKVDAASKKVLDTQVFGFLMRGPAGYRVELQHPMQTDAKYSEPRQLTLRIESTDEKFATVTKDLLKPFPPPSGSSTGHINNSPIAFPNQPRNYERNSGPGLLLNKMRWSISPKDEARYLLNFEMRVLSDGPMMITPFQGGFGDKSKLKYSGSGKFILDETNQRNK